MSQNSIISQIESSIKFLMEYEKDSKHPDYGNWEERFLKETDKLIDRNLRIRVDNIINFRGKQIFVPDQPSAYLKFFYSSNPLYYSFKKIFNWLWGSSRGGIREALDSLESIEKANFFQFLKKYPSPKIGRPLNMHYKGCSFTNRYLRHIYFLGLFKQYLKSKVNEDSIFLDIGSSYGIFSSLAKQEMQESHHVLVDMPGQLILAHFYLSVLFPKAKIAGFKDVGKEKKIDKDFIEQFDFVLVPTSMYNKLTAHSVDIVTNFVSFAEMTKEWFNTYIESEVFKTAPFFYTVNRYDSYPTYQNNITILDYPLKEYEKIYMRTCPLFRFYYKGFLLFFCKRDSYPSQFFQFIGKKIDI